MNELLIIDQSSRPYDGPLLFPFAAEELLCRKVGEDELPAIAYFWRYSKGLVLGLRDRKLPDAKKAIQTFEQDGYRTCVRHSGGAAVPLDEGVVNVSLILQKPKGRVDFHDDFRTMASIIQQSVAMLANDPNMSVDIGEIKDSYCPGDFDMSIQGRKFCGLAQRRQTRAISVQAFIIASGEGTRRAKLARSYYDLAAVKNPHLDYPNVSLNSMGSLEELVHLEDEASLIRAIKTELRNRYERIEETDQLPLDHEAVDEMIAKLNKRYGGRD